MIDQLKANILNVDTVKEIFDLWYELMFLKFIVSEALSINCEISTAMKDPQVFERCRNKAQLFLKEKFKIDLEFKNPKEIK